MDVNVKVISADQICYIKYDTLVRFEYFKEAFSKNKLQEEEQENVTLYRIPNITVGCSAIILKALCYFHKRCRGDWIMFEVGEDGHPYLSKYSDFHYCTIFDPKKWKDIDVIDLMKYNNMFQIGLKFGICSINNCFADYTRTWAFPNCMYLGKTPPYSKIFKVIYRTKERYPSENPFQLISDRNLCQDLLYCAYLSLNKLKLFILKDVLEAIELYEDIDLLPKIEDIVFKDNERDEEPSLLALKFVINCCKNGYIDLVKKTITSDILLKKIEIDIKN